jgi:hypothetical protein
MATTFHHRIGELLKVNLLAVHAWCRIEVRFYNSKVLFAGFLEGFLGALPDFSSSSNASCAAIWSSPKLEVAEQKHTATTKSFPHTKPLQIFKFPCWRC